MMFIHKPHPKHELALIDSMYRFDSAYNSHPESI